MFVYTAGIDLIVNRADLFGKPVSLNFNGKDKSKSPIGAFFSGIVLVFFIWAMYIFSQDMFKKKNPKTITSESFHENPAEMIITPDTFAFAFGLQDPVSYFHYINSSIYTVEITRTQLSRERQPDGSLSEVWSSVPLEYETCTTAHFGEMGAKFADIELNELYCIKQHQPALDEIKIQGVFESPVYQYIQAQIKACDNTTSGGTCGTPDELHYYLGGGFFATYFTNTAVDPKDYKNPNLKYRDSYYSSLTAPYYKEVTLYLAHLEVKSDVGWLVESEEVESFIKFERNVENLMFREDVGSVLNFVVRVDKIKTHYERSYTKISDVFAQVNGLGSAIIIAFAFFLRPYSDIKFNESLINELFDIKTPDGFGGGRQGGGKGVGKGGKGDKKSKKVKRSNSKSGGEKTLNRKNSKTEDPNKKGKKEEGGHHLKIDVLFDKSPMNSMMQSPSDSFNFSKVPLNQSPTREPQYADETMSMEKVQRDNTMKFSSPPSLSILDPKPVQYDTNRGEDQSTYRIPDTMRADDISLIASGKNSKGMTDSGTYRSQLLQYKPASVKPVNKILEHYDEQSHGEIDMVLENLIQTKNEIMVKRGDSPMVKKKGSFVERAGFYKTGTFKEERGDDSTIVDEDLKAKAKELPEKLSKSSYKLNITFFEYLQSIFWKSKELKEKFKLLNEGVRRIEERLDIFKVFKKFREVDKMRLLMFESEQLVLFDSLPKPELALKEDKADEEELEKKKSVEHIRESRFIGEKRKNDLIALSYENMKRKYEKSMIDDRLLDIYDNLE